MSEDQQIFPFKHSFYSECYDEPVHLKSSNSDQNGQECKISFDLSDEEKEE